MIRFIANYFQKTESYSTGRFIFEMFFLSSLPKLFVIFLYSLFIFLDIEVEFIFGDMEESNTGSILGDMHWIGGFILICVLIPLFETFVFQVLPIYFLLIVIKNRFALVLLSSFFFVFMHKLQPLAILLMIFLSGIIYAWSFLVYKKQGFLKGLLITSVIHALFNFVGFLAYYIWPEI